MHISEVHDKYLPCRMTSSSLEARKPSFRMHHCCLCSTQAVVKQTVTVTSTLNTPRRFHAVGTLTRSKLVRLYSPENCYERCILSCTTLCIHIMVCGLHAEHSDAGTSAREERSVDIGGANASKVVEQAHMSVQHRAPLHVSREYSCFSTEAADSDQCLETACD